MGGDLQGLGVKITQGGLLVKEQTTKKQTTSRKRSKEYLREQTERPVGGPWKEDRPPNSGIVMIIVTK